MSRRTWLLAVASVLLVGGPIGNALATEGPALIVITSEISSGKDDQFRFTGELGEGELPNRSFTLATSFGRASINFTIEERGTFTVTQDLHPALVLKEIVCTNDSAVDLAARTVEIHVELGEQVLCRFISEFAPL